MLNKVKKILKINLIKLVLYNLNLLRKIIIIILFQLFLVGSLRNKMQVVRCLEEVSLLYIILPIKLLIGIGFRMRRRRIRGLSFIVIGLVIVAPKDFILSKVFAVFWVEKKMWLALIALKRSRFQDVVVLAESATFDQVIVFKTNLLIPP